MDLEGLDIVLTSLTHDLKDLDREAPELLEDTQATAARLDDLEARLARLRGALPVELPATPVHAPLPLRTERQRHDLPKSDWEMIYTQAEMSLRARGVDPATVTLNDLLDPVEVARIERRFRGGFTLSAHLDKYDVAAAVAAGLVAGLVDFLIVKIPKDVIYLGRFIQEGSPFTKWLHSIEIPADNWLARHFRTSYDLVNGITADIAGFHPKSHRLQTFGHDPLVGLVIGTIDIMRGGLTAISRDGKIFWLSQTGPAHYNPLTALVWQIMHLLSDGFTKMGLPAPGWTLLQLLQVGSFGEKERTIAELARYMYLNGYDSRHFLTMSASVAAAEVVLRGYFWLRRKMDQDYETEAAHLGEVARARGTSDHPRFQAMALAAHTVAVAANAGKVAIYQGNPLAINYAQWLRFFHATFAWLHTKMRSPSDILMGHAYANWKALEQGWPVIDINDTSFPTLVIEG